MRNRRRHCSVRGGAAGARRVDPCLGRSPTGLDLMAMARRPGLASDAQKPFIMPHPRPTETRSGRPTSRPQPQRLHRARGAELAGLHAPLLRPLGRRGPRRPRRPQRRSRRRRRPRLRRAGAAGRRTRPRGRERQARLARAAQRRARGRRQRQDRRLPLPDRRRAVRLRGARPRPGRPSSTGCRAACTATSSSTTTTSPFEFPGTKPLHDLEVTFAHEYNHILQFGYDAYQDAWFAESTRDLDGGPGLQRHQRLPALRAPLGQALRHAADGELDQGVRLAPSGTSGWRTATGRAIIRKAWAGAIHARPGGFSVAAYERAIRAAGGARTSSHDFARFAADVAEWRTGERLPRERPLPGHAAPGQPAARRARRLTRLAQPHDLPAAAGHARGRGRAVVVHAAPRGRPPPGVALVGRIGSERHGQRRLPPRLQRNGGRLTVRLPDPGASTGSPRSSSTPTRAPTASAPGSSTGAT